MSLRNRLVLPIILFALAILAGCGNTTNNPVAPPTGGFTNSNFNGNYTFSVFGSDGATYAVAGSLTACGCSGGTISAGTVDLFDATSGTPLLAPGSTITGGTYSVTKDGRGTAKLTITNSTISLNTQIQVDFVLTSSSHGLIIQFDGNATGSGTLDSQPTAVTQSSIANTPFAFTLSGTDFSGNPLATVGAFTLDGSGLITAGVEDFNYNFSPAANLPLSGSLTVGSGTAPGGASFATSFAPGGFGFDVYAVDSTHLKLIEWDAQAILVGDAFTQPTASIPAGNLVFTMAGFDTAGQSPFVVGGVMPTDGSSGSEDINEGGTVDGGTTTPLAFTANFASTGGGRSQATLSNFAGGALFAAYPSSGGIFMLEIDAGLNPGITSGVAMAQSATTIGAQGYGLNLTGVDPNGEVDEIAEFTATTTNMTGLIDVNDGSTDTHNLSGTYSVGSNGVGSASFNAGLAGMFFYVADSSTALFISTDSGQVALGSFQTQTTPTSLSNMTQQHLAMLRSIHAPHSASKQKKSNFHLPK